MLSKILISQKKQQFSRLFTDDNLTKKAYLNALASALDYGARILVALLITPLMVAGLGDYFFGVWQILNRMVGYLAPTSGKPTEVLKSTIANQQNSIDYGSKRSYIGASLLLWAFFLPITGIAGGIITWFVPYWIHSPEEFVGIVRTTTGLLVANLATTSVSTLPQSVLEGENLGYKRIGISVLLIFFSGGLTWVILFLGKGIIGVASVAVITTLFAGLIYLVIARSYIPWFGIALPPRNQIKDFAGLSWWFLSWNLLMNLMIASDVVLLGLLGSVESVTPYTLTKYIPETLISVVAIMFFGIVPGLGGIIGSGDLKRAARVRGELMAITWLIATVLGASIIIWNRTFIELWVSKDYFVGALPNLLIVLVVVQFVFIRNDSNIIDVTLHLKSKIITGVISISLSLIAAIILVKYFNLGIIGLCIGILFGRSIMSFGFPFLIIRYLKASLASQIKGVLRPGLVTIFIFLFAFWFSSEIPHNTFTGVQGWLLFIVSVCLTSGLIFIVVILTGFSDFQRMNLASRIRLLVLKS